LSLLFDARAMGFISAFMAITLMLIVMSVFIMCWWLNWILISLSCLLVLLSSLLCYVGRRKVMQQCFVMLKRLHYDLIKLSLVFRLLHCVPIGTWCDNFCLAHNLYNTFCLVQFFWNPIFFLFCLDFGKLFTILRLFGTRESIRRKADHGGHIVIWYW
jgi:hypothetical protein